MTSRAVQVTAVFLLCISMIGCSTEPPSVRIMNERTTKVNIQLKVGTDNTININDVDGGAATAYRDITAGLYVVTATIQSESDAPTASFNASEDNNYTVVVVNSTPPTVRVDASGK